MPAQQGVAGGMLQVGWQIQGCVREETEGGRSHVSCAHAQAAQLVAHAGGTYRPAADLAWEPVPQEVGGVFWRLHESKEPLKP